MINNLVYGNYGGDGGNGSDGGPGGDGGQGGVGVNSDGGDGGAGGAGGTSGNASDGVGIHSDGAAAASRLGIHSDIAAATPRVVNNTVDRLDRGEVGNPGSGGAGGSAGAAGSGAPGAVGDPGGAGQIGTDGKTVGLYFTGGAAGDVYNNIIVRTVYTDDLYYVGAYTNSFGILAEAASGPTALDYNDVWGWETKYNGVASGTHDISADPMFVDVLCMDCENFRLNVGTPCGDTASDAQAPRGDRVNILRPQDRDEDGVAIADMGAYECFVPDDVVIPCDATGVFSTTDGILEFEWEVGMCVTCTITTTYIPLAAPHHHTGALDFGNVAFELAAVDCHGDPVTSFTPPISLTIHYDSLPPLTMDEDTISLYHWDVRTEQWVVLTVLARDATANTLTVNLEHLSEFALLGTVVQHKVYLPLVLRNYAP